MEDMERYGDYNEVDEAPGGRRSPVGLILKILIFLVCLAVVGVLAFRIFLFNYYPEAMKDIYYTESLKAYVTEKGEAVAESQDLRFPYDNADKANFFCDNLIVVREAGQLQVSLRFNVSFAEDMEKQYGVKIDPEDDELFTFALTNTLSGYEGDGDEGEVPVEQNGSLVDVQRESLMMYRYYKLSFDNVKFADGGENIHWIRLEVTVKGLEEAGPFKILVYENNGNFSAFEEYGKVTEGDFN